MKVLINRYKIESNIDLGKLSKNYVAIDLTNNKKVIIESFDITQLQDPGTVNNINYQIEVCKTLNNPYFMRYLSSFKNNNSFYIVWDYVDVSKIFDNKSLDKLSHRDMYVFISKVLRALDHAHKCGVIHGTLSTDSILITPSLEPIIIGFLTPGVVASTDPGISRGPNSYDCAAPELFTGERIDESCDFYSIGIISKYLLSQIDTRTQVSRISSSIPAEIQRAQQLVNKLTSTARQERIQSAIYLIDDDFLHSLSTPAGGVEKIKVSKRKSRKMRKALKTKKPMNDRTAIFMAIAVKASVIALIAILVLLLFTQVLLKN